MKNFKLEQKIVSLSDIYTGTPIKERSFTCEGIYFSQWDKNRRDEHAWIAKYTTKARNLNSALVSFSNKLSRIVPRISLICQTHINHLGQPFAATKEGSDMAFVRLTVEEDPVPMMFWKDEQEALRLLLQDKRVPDEFYYYWNDLTNTTVYSSKLALITSALDSLAKGLSIDKRDFRNTILGKELCEEIFAQHKGLRNTLAHGEYLSNNNDKNYVEIIHNKVIKYFNKEILKKDLITESIIGPQRNFVGNNLVTRQCIQQVSDEWPLELISIIKSFNKHSDPTMLLEDYKWITNDAIIKKFIEE